VICEVCAVLCEVCAVLCEVCAVLCEVCETVWLGICLWICLWICQDCPGLAVWHGFSGLAGFMRFCHV